MSDLITTDVGLSSNERTVLARLFGYMIPADETLAVPGADDPAIFADILNTGRRSVDALKRSVSRLLELSVALTGQPLEALNDAAFSEVAQALRKDAQVPVALLESLVAQCYYRDERVMTSLDMPARAPFPGGYEIPQGDWSLLEPVKARKPFYRAT